MSDYDLVTLSLRDIVVDANEVEMAPEPMLLSVPRDSHAMGKLTVRKENGVIKGFDYVCVCGHRESFVCE